MSRRNCPTCGTPSIPILYGYPAPSAVEADQRGELHIGGCVLEPDQPTRWCPLCGEPLPVGSMASGFARAEED